MAHQHRGPICLVRHGSSEPLDEGTTALTTHRSPKPADDHRHHGGHPKLQLKWKVKLKGNEGARHNPAGQAWRPLNGPDYLWLFDFPVGSPALGTAHKDALAQFARSASNHPPDKSDVEIEGMTSTTDSETHNVDLSDDRAWAVEERLRSSLNGYKISVKGTGERRATEAGEPNDKENPIWRAVKVRFVDKKIPPPPPPPPPPLEKAIEGRSRKRFWIHAVGGYTISIAPPKALKIKFASLNLDFITFKIIDEQSKRIANFKYRAIGAAAGPGSTDIKHVEKLWKKIAKSLSPVQPTIYIGHTKWSAFDVEKDWTLEQIIGEAHLYGYGINIPIADWSAGHTNLKFSRQKNWHHADFQEIPDIDLGVSVSLPAAGVSITMGQFFMDGNPERYNGPLPPE